LPVSQRLSRILERQRTNSARAAAHKFQIDGAVRSAASGGDCWPCIFSVPGSGSSFDGRRLLLAGLPMGTFRQWLMVNAGAPMGVIQSVAGVGVQAWRSGQPEATRCSNSSTSCCSFYSKESPRFSSLSALGGVWVLNNVDPSSMRLPSFFQTSSIDGPTDRAPVDRR
jgi:hypothetical protein